MSCAFMSTAAWRRADREAPWRLPQINITTLLVSPHAPLCFLMLPMVSWYWKLATAANWLSNGALFYYSYCDVAVHFVLSMNQLALVASACLQVILSYCLHCLPHFFRCNLCTQLHWFSWKQWTLVAVELVFVFCCCNSSSSLLWLWCQTPPELN